jgi:hypothetical protein
MELQGTVQNGVIVLDCRDPLPEGTRVTIVVDSRRAGSDRLTLWERLLKFAGIVDDLPPDMARNHDHYIHGAPRQ